MEENSGSRPRLGSRLSLSSRLEKLSQGSLPSQSGLPNSAASQPLSGTSLPPSATGTHPVPLRRAPLLARPLKNTAPSPEEEADEFDLLDALLEDDAEEEKELENSEKKQPPPPLKAAAKPQLKPLSAAPITNSSVLAPAVGLQKKVNPFSRKTTLGTGGSGNTGTAAAPRHVTLARQAPPASINIDSTPMLQSVLGPAMAFKKPSVVAPAPTKKEQPVQNNTSGGSGDDVSRKKEIRQLVDEEDDDDDDFVKPAPKKPLISRQVPLVRKPPGPLPQKKNKEEEGVWRAPTATTMATGLEQRPLGNSDSNAGVFGAIQRFQAPRMTQPPPQQQQQLHQEEEEHRPPPPPQQRQQQQQQRPLETDIIDLSKDEYPSHPLPESPNAAVWLSDPYLEQQQQQQQQQQIYRQPNAGAGVANYPQPQPQIWRAPQDSNMNNSVGGGGIFGAPPAPAVGGIFAQPPPQQLGGVFAPAPLIQQPQYQPQSNYNNNDGEDDWNIPAGVYNNNNNQQQQQQQRYQAVGGGGVGGGGTNSAGGGRSWWYRLPDLVPVFVLQLGHNPRDGTIVHIDYKNQFSGKSGGGATAAAKKAARAVGGVATSAKGYWLTISGVKTYIDKNGKELTGRAAWAASKKENGKETGGGSSSGGRKKKSAGGSRKRATKKSTSRR